MRKNLCLTISLCLCSCLAFANTTQTGIVKTKGRLNEDQTIIKGEPLSDAYVTIQGAQTVSTNKKGLFSVALTSKDYCLKEVNKDGYVLCDVDMLSRSYAYSPNPLYVVMETPAQQMEDKLLAERKLRRTLQCQLQQREDEIDSLRTRQQISDDEYRQQLQQIYAEQEENERLIKEMADRYASIDYDQLDEFNRQISTLILSGKLSEADSLIRSKGNITSRVESLKEHQEKNQQEEQAIKKRMKALEKSKAYTQKELEDLAQDCYSLYEIFKMQHKNDSAAYYLELRASLDTTNVEWQIETGDFIAKYNAEYDHALSYYNHALSGSRGVDELQARCYLCIGSLYNSIHDYNTANVMLDTALYYSAKSISGKSPLLVDIYNQQGLAYSKIYQFDKAHEYYNKALDLVLDVYGDEDAETAKVFFNLGGFAIEQAQYEKAMQYLQKSEQIFMANKGNYELELANVKSNIGTLYGKLGLYDESIEKLKEALALRLSIIREKHPIIASSYQNIGSEYSAKQNYDSAIVYYKKAVEINEIVLGPENPGTLKSLFSVGSTYVFMEQDSIGEEVLLSCLAKYKNTIGINNSVVADIYSNLISICIKRHDYERAKEYLIIEEQIKKQTHGEDHPQYAIVLAGFADVFDEIGDYNHALEYYEKAYNLLMRFLPIDHPAVVLMKTQIEIQQDKLGYSHMK